MPAGILSTINKCLDIYSSVIAFFIIFSVYLNNKNRTKIDKLFALTCLVDFFLAIFDCLAIFAEQKNTEISYFWVRFCNFCFYFFSIAIYNAYILFIVEFFNVKKHKKAVNTINLICFIGFLVGLMVTLFYPFYYYIDENNVYHRGDFYYISLIYQFILLILAIIITFSKKNKIAKNLRLAFASFMFIPVAMQLIQIAFYGISLINIGITISFFIIFINLNINLENQVIATQEQIVHEEEKIIAIQNNTINSLSNLVENRDSDTGNHVQRTSLYVNLLAKNAKEKGIYSDQLTEHYIDLITKAAPLHDIGKIVVPDYILKKPGKLTDEEFAKMQNHTTEGKRIVKEILGIGNNTDYVEIATEIATYHHEKWNGTGYPEKLTAENIPLSARIMAVADVFDALVSPRCYKPPFTIERAFQILTDDSGQHFDPQLVPVFIESRAEIEKIMKEYGSDL
ncbi:MAG: HD domain-containing protein [Treponema sp.]|nr:HD domain-containing protein [Treponema sp.]